MARKKVKKKIKRKSKKKVKKKSIKTKKKAKKKTKKKTIKKSISKKQKSKTPELIAIRIHGRGGQGAKTAAQFIAEAATHIKGVYVQAFPEYGPERLGAPVISYVRISKKPIYTFAGVENPDIVLIIDHTLLDDMDLSYGLKKNGLLIVNEKQMSADLLKKLQFKGKIAIVDATKIALDLIKKYKPNMPLIGAMVKLTNIFPIEDINFVIKCNFERKLGSKVMQANQQAVKKGYDEVKVVQK